MGNINLTFDRNSPTLVNIGTVGDFKRVFGIYSKETIKNVKIDFYMDLYLYFAYRGMPCIMSHLEKKYNWDIYTVTRSYQKNAYMIAVENNNLNVLKYLDSKNYDIYRTCLVGMNCNAYQLQPYVINKTTYEYLQNRYFGTEEKMIETCIKSKNYLYKNKYGSCLMYYSMRKRWKTAIVCILNRCNELWKYLMYLNYFISEMIDINDFHIFELLIFGKIGTIKSNPDWLRRIMIKINAYDYLDGYKYIEDIGLLKGKKMDIPFKKNIKNYIQSNNKPKHLDSLSGKIVDEIENYIDDFVGKNKKIVSDMKGTFDQIRDILKST